MSAGGSERDFARYDWDGNGSLERDELEAMMAAKLRAAEELQRIDIDGGGGRGSALDVQPRRRVPGGAGRGPRRRGAPEVPGRVPRLGC